MFVPEKDGISYIIAGYNEEKDIEESFSKCYDALFKNFEKFEIILVDDGSNDNTAQLMAQMQERYPEVRFLRNYVNLNFGISVLRGIKAAKYRYITYNAADLPLDPEILPQLLIEMGDADVLVLEREEYKPRLWRRITSAINRSMIKIFFPIATKNISTFNFIQIFNAEHLQRLIPFARSPIFAFAEMIIRARTFGMEVKAKAVQCNLGNRAGAFGKPHDIMWGIYEILRFRIRKWNKSIED